MIRDRVNAGLAATHSHGVRLGRPTTLGRHRDEVMALKATGLGVRGIARQLKMLASSVYKITKQAAANA